MDSIEATPPSGHRAIKDVLESRLSVGEWFDDNYLATPRIRYECETDVTGIAADFSIVVAFTGDPSVTVSHVLNRSRCDDLAMAEHLVMVCDERDPFVY